MVRGNEVPAGCLHRGLGKRAAILVALLGTVLASVLLTPQATNAAPENPDMSGSWQMDSAKSHVADGRVVNLVIENAGGNKIKVTFTAQDKGGKEVNSQFVCGSDGKECAFDEGGHKSKVMTWFAGPTFMIAKTDGPADDSVSEMSFQVSSDKKELTCSINHLEPAREAETLVFSKK